MEPILEFMFKDLKPTSVLELGVGTGGFLTDIKKHMPSVVRFGGIDTSRDIEETKAKFPEQKENFIYHNLYERWPLEDKSYDVVYTVGVLMYILNPELVIREALRVAKDYVIFAEPQCLWMSAFGDIKKFENNNTKNTYGIVRNYRPILQGMGRTYEESDMGSKTIMKIKTNV